MAPPHPFYTISYLKDQFNKQKVLEFLQAADLAITDIQINRQKRVQRPLNLESGNAAIGSEQETEVPSAILFHQNKNNHRIGFTLNKESHGTQKLFAFAGPILNTLDAGKILVVDELDSSLHPKLVRFLVSLIHNTDLNKNNAQLFFTAQNTALLDSDVFRRDQIWFIEKDQEQATHLYPLTDFSPRKGEALEKGYLEGRYGALPLLSEFNL